MTAYHAPRFGPVGSNDDRPSCAERMVLVIGFHLAELVLDLVDLDVHVIQVVDDADGLSGEGHTGSADQDRGVFERVRGPVDQLQLLTQSINTCYWE